MRGRMRLVALLSLAALLLPRWSHAQASISGVVRDVSGAVLPGVTVEASSPALIEKTRTVVTDGTGQYRIVDLRPGTYAVSYALQGFATVRAEPRRRISYSKLRRSPQRLSMLWIQP